MAIGTYAELVQAIQDWMMDRSDLAPRAPDFIAMGEGVIAYGSEQVTPLRCREMETVMSLAPVSGVCALPDDYLQYRRVVDTGTPRRNLGYVTPDAAELYYPERAAGTAEKFTIIGADLQTFPLTANAVELTYYARVPALTALSATNWLLQKHPGIYLRASLLMAAEFIKDASETATQAALLSSLIKGMNDQSMLANYAKAGIMPGRAIALMGAFANYEPDRTIFNPAAATEILNAVPVADGWGPMPDLVVYSLALPARCFGAVYVRSSSGAFSVIAGTQTRLYRLNPATLAWDDVSGPAAPYSVPDSDRWSFARFGSKLLATCIGSPLQIYDVDAPANFVSAAGSPPQAKYVTVAGDFVMLAHLQGLPQRVRWSGINNAEFWTSGDRGSDYQDFPDGEDITGAFGDETGVVVVQRKMFRVGTFDPASGFIFRFQVANPSRGSIAPLSIVQIGPRDFVYLCEDGFFRGIAGNAIGAERVDSSFLDAIDHADIAVVRGVADPFKKIAWFAWTSAVGISKLLGYNWQLDRWTQAENDITELAASVSSGHTLNAMDAFGELDDIAIPLDSRFWLGGVPSFVAFDNSNRLCFFTGAPREATLTTADEQLTPGLRSFVSPRGIRVVTDAADFTVRVTTSDFPGGARTQGAALSPSAVTGLVPCRRSGLLFACEVTIPAGTAWKHAIGIDYGAIPEGRR